MDPILFEKCIIHIKKNYEIRIFEELMTSGDYLNKSDYATIMFDDGYKDNIDIALPILEKHNVKATFYIVTDCIEKNIPTWTHILEYCFQNFKSAYINLDFDFLPEELRNVEFDEKTTPLVYARQLKPQLKKIAHFKRVIVLQEIQKITKIDKLPELMMNWDDIKKLISKGHYVGSHTVNHFMLGTVDDENIITKELKESREIIHSKLGFYPRTISYPVGSYNKATINLSQKLGYQFGLAVKQDIFNPNKHSKFEIPRIELYNESWFKTKLRISHILEKIKFLIRYRK
tara:strand:+ start:136 stop:999 length:864 start_codon:yes stop_codon:yes gene_type:complete